MLCLSNFKVFVVIFMLCACNIIQHKINFMLYIFNFIVQVIILLGTFNFMVPLINCMTYLFHFVVIHIINFTLFVFPFRCI